MVAKGKFTTGVLGLIHTIGAFGLSRDAIWLTCVLLSGCHDASKTASREECHGRKEILGFTPQRSSILPAAGGDMIGRLFRRRCAKASMHDGGKFKEQN